MAQPRGSWPSTAGSLGATLHTTLLLRPSVLAVVASHIAALPMLALGRPMELPIGSAAQERRSPGLTPGSGDGRPGCLLLQTDEAGEQGVDLLLGDGRRKRRRGTGGSQAAGDGDPFAGIYGVLPRCPPPARRSSGLRRPLRAAAPPPASPQRRSSPMWQAECCGGSSPAARQRD
ncbi:hypothetical protein U9M48_029988 [Paspalum notatum var. saurae]|uniref:Uncharacterized protein n=1 Tax=Paspalum notatum var. saurae TaxID=547442 RepID=A0AAQ3U0L1_PASNO